jgi:hypothetical protein
MTVTDFDARGRAIRAAAPLQRRYLPTLADLIDRLSICQLKAIFIPESKADYDAEIALILHDVDLILGERGPLTAADLRAAMVVMLANRVIWENESRARAGGPEQDHLLKFTHSINGVRNRAKNELSRAAGERVDRKVDCFAADLDPELGNWQIY